MSLIIKSFTYLNSTLSSCRPTNVIALWQVRNYAARKGTREKARKKKVKVEEKKIGFIPHNQRGLDKQLLNRKIRKFDDSWKSLPVDNVYPVKYYRWKVYPFAEAVQCHQETHHPTMFDKPDAPLNVIIELNMQAEKKNRFIDNFRRVAYIPHPYEHGEERTVLAFSKDTEMQKIARDCGASLAGGVELIKEIQNGSLVLSDFQYVIAHPNILPELVVLRGVMKKKFPQPKFGTLGPDFKEMVQKFVSGISYAATKDEHELDFGIIETSLGPLTLGAEKLEENFEYLLKDVFSAKSRRKGSFIRRCLLVSPPSPEKLKVDHNLYVDDAVKDDIEEDEEEAEAERIAVQ